MLEFLGRGRVDWVAAASIHRRGGKSGLHQDRVLGNSQAPAALVRGWGRKVAQKHTVPACRDKGEIGR